MKKTLASLASLFLVGSLLADGAAPAAPAAEKAPETKKPLKVLMIGNSFSVCVLKQMPAIAAELGLPLDICSMYIGGCSLAKHAANARKPETNPYSISWRYASLKKDEEPPFQAALVGEKKKRSNIPAMLAADKWDVVTIQQASHESWRPASYEPHGTELLALIAKLAPQAKVYVQQTWSYTPWDGRLAKWKLDPAGMYEQIEKAYDAFAKAHGLEQIRTGEAIQIYRRELPVAYTEKSLGGDVCGKDSFEEKDGKWVHKGDAFHLNPQGEYLQGLVWTAKLFGADVTAATNVPPALAKTPERAELMRRIAVRVAGGARK